MKTTSNPAKIAIKYFISFPPCGITCLFCSLALLFFNLILFQIPAILFKSETIPKSVHTANKPNQTRVQLKLWLMIYTLKGE